jgi:hypothetical protein
MSDDKKGWTPDRVRKHLMNAVYLEMWTIPLYLTAAYSLKVPLNPNTNRPEFAPVPTKPDGRPDFERFGQTDYDQYAFNSVLSVAIQEMLHVELAANILNAVRPTIKSPPGTWVEFTGDQASNYTSLPACLAGAQLPAGVELRLGPMDVNQARLFQWIEHEDPMPFGDPEQYQENYQAIGGFYTALRYGMMVCWPELYPPEGVGPDPTPDELLQKNDWGSALSSMRSGFLRFLFSGSQPDITADDAVNAAADYDFSIMVYGWPADAWIRTDAALMGIRVQGEGSGAGEDIPPTFRPTQGDSIDLALDRFSHWERFTNILKLVQAGTIQVYEPKPDNCLPDPILEELQKALNQSYSSFLVNLETAYNSDSAANISLSLDAMRGVGNRTLQVWQYGGTPEYKWDDPSQYQKPGFHACQGLNQAGDSTCATAFYHTCAQTNTCAGQGGCGYQGDPNDPGDNWVPNFNACLNKGGCGAPIPYGQIFSDDAPAVDAKGRKVRGQCVWTYARELMRDKYPNFPTTDPPPYELRKILTPTSGPTPPADQDTPC